MAFHWLTVKRLMAVSGRFTALVDRVRHGPVQEMPEMDTAQLIAALKAATAAEFGASSDAEPAPVVQVSAENSPVALNVRPRSYEHFLFFFGITLGAFLAFSLYGSGEPTLGLRSTGLAVISSGNSFIEWTLLSVGGVLVGFGTRMSGGCTSGHGMCGVSRVQPGSLLATASFFGAGILTSYALSAVFF